MKAPRTKKNRLMLTKSDQNAHDIGGDCCRREASGNNIIFTRYYLMDEVAKRAPEEDLVVSFWFWPDS